MILRQNTLDYFNCAKSVKKYLIVSRLSEKNSWQYIKKHLEARHESSNKSEKNGKINEVENDDP